MYMNRERRCSPPCSGTCIRASTRHLPCTFETLHILAPWYRPGSSCCWGCRSQLARNSSPPHHINAAIAGFAKHSRSSTGTRKNQVKLPEEKMAPGRGSTPCHATGPEVRVHSFVDRNRQRDGQRAGRHEEAARCHRCCMRETARETPQQESLRRQQSRPQCIRVWRSKGANFQLLHTHARA